MLSFTATAIAFVNQRHVTEDTLNEAIATVINGYNQFSLTEDLGSGQRRLYSLFRGSSRHVCLRRAFARLLPSGKVVST